MEIPKGNREIKFEFVPKVVNKGFYLSLFSYLIFITVFIKFILLTKRMYNKIPKKRYQRTLSMLREVCPSPSVSI